MYILLFTCAVVRAVHLELVDSLTTEDFCHALRRFGSRRAIPGVVYCDNALTFKGAEKLVRNILGYEMIQWKKQPALAPWWGGFYERMVRSVKSGIRKSIGKLLVTKKQLETSLIEVEACVNSRPLLQTSDCDTYLTPSHFLIGRGCPLNPQELAKVGDMSRVPLYEEHTNMVISFWEVWQRDYLRSLPPLKTRKGSSNLKLGSLVLVQDEHKKRLQWDLGIVEEVYVGLDEKIRAAKVKTKTSNLVRPVQRLLLLELDHHSIQEDDVSQGSATREGEGRHSHDNEGHPSPPDTSKVTQVGDQRVSRFGRKIKDKTKPSL